MNDEPEAGENNWRKQVERFRQRCVRLLAQRTTCGFHSAGSSISNPCRTSTSLSNTDCAFLDQSHFLFKSPRIHPRTPICRCANPIRKIRARFNFQRQPALSAPVSLLQCAKILGNEGSRIGISNANVIAGNPRTGRLMVTLSVALLLLILMSAAFIAMRKRTAPQKEPPLPLHPASLVV